MPPTALRTRSWPRSTYRAVSVFATGAPCFSASPSAGPWTNCGGGDTIYIVLVALPEDNSFLVFVAIQAISEADLEALDRILDTFIVDV